MNKKVIIQIVIILAGFIGAGMVLYNGFFKGNSTSSTLKLESEPIAGIGQEAILPYGATLDFNILKKQNLFFNQVIYPKLDPNNDYGISPENLIVSPLAN